MTQNQIAYNQLKETRRHNYATEMAETSKITETGRHNLVVEDNAARSLSEQIRHSQVDEWLNRYRTDTQAATAASDRASRESVSALERASRERVADADRWAQQQMNAAKLYSDQMITQAKLANAKEVSKQEIDARASESALYRRWEGEHRNADREWNAAIQTNAQWSNFLSSIVGGMGHVQTAQVAGNYRLEEQQQRFEEQRRIREENAAKRGES